MGIPTHFRFKNENEAKIYDCTTKQWCKIEEIHRFGKNYWHISTTNFAWVDYDVLKPNLEFKVIK